MTNNCEKQRVQITITKRMVNHVIDKKPDHMTRSVYVEDMFWKGVQDSKIIEALDERLSK